ncbi:unnamed protein product, partial [Iphiclides podalirius]
MAPEIDNGGHRTGPIDLPPRPPPAPATINHPPSTECPLACSVVTEKAVIALRVTSRQELRSERSQIEFQARLMTPYSRSPKYRGF